MVPHHLAPGNPTKFFRAFDSENTNLKQGQIQQFNITWSVNCRANRADGWIRWVPQFPYSQLRNNINTSSPNACAGGPDPVAGYTLGCGPGGAYIPLAYPNFPYSTIYSVNDFGRAHYNSLQIKAETKSARYGLYALIGYSYSRTYDSGFSDGLSTPIGAPDFPLPGYQKLDWALSQINLDNSFTASIIYDLPFGKGKKFGNSWNNVTNALLGNWQVTVIEKITSGFPVFIIDSNPDSGANLINVGTGSPAGRANEVGNPFQAGTIAGCTGPSKLTASGYWFNPVLSRSPRQVNWGIHPEPHLPGQTS